MKRTFLFLLFFPLVLHSQEKINDLKSPTSPASSILGAQPTVILNPKSYQALEAALFSNFTNNNTTVIPNDFALEFTPYWAKNHGHSLNEVLFPSGWFEQIKRTFSISLASTQNFLLEDQTPSNSISMGARTSFYFSSDTDKKIINSYRTEIYKNDEILGRIGREAELLLAQESGITSSDLLEKMQGLITNVFKDFKVEDADNIVTIINRRIEKEAKVDQVSPQELLDTFYGIIDEELKTFSKFEEFKGYIEDRQGLSMDIAIGLLLNFPTANFEQSYIPRHSFWFTPTYKLKGNADFLRVLGVFRYEWYHKDYFKEFFPTRELFENNLDFGGGITAKFQKFSLKLETVGRISETELPAGTDINGNELYYKDKSSDFQYVGTFSYNLSDQIVLPIT